MTTLSREQAAELLEYRCGLISYDGFIDHAALRVGSPSACLPILRFLFINLGYNLRPMEVQGAMLCVQLGKLLDYSIENYMNS